MSKSLALAIVLVTCAAAAACHRARRPASSISGDAPASEAETRAAPVLERYGLDDIELRFPDGLMRARERASPIAFEKALALAIETFLAYREHPESPGARALAAARDSSCPEHSPVAALSCVLRHRDATIGLAGALFEVAPAEEIAQRRAYFTFALRIPTLSARPFWFAVGPAGAADAVATWIPAPLAPEPVAP